jgi:hypothetical protein
MTEVMGVEGRNAKEKTSDKKKEKLKDVLKRVAKPLVDVTVAVATVAVISAGGCSLDLKGTYHQTDGRIDVTEVQDERTEDIRIDEIEDVKVEDNREDVSVEDVVDDKMDVADGEEDVESEDVGGEEDVKEEDAPVDVPEEDVAAEDVTTDEDAEDIEGEELPACEPVPDVATVFIGTGSSSTVGNVTVEYGGLDTSGNGIYVISCDGSEVGTLYIAEGGVDSLDLGGGYSVEITANTARAHGSNATIRVS